MLLLEAFCFVFFAYLHDTTSTAIMIKKTFVPFIKHQFPYLETTQLTFVFENMLFIY